MDDDLIACAGLVERGDPVRFRATMAAPLAARSVLFPLYAFNLEVARAPWVTQEPMIARMRLQWWRDALEEIGAGGVIRRHEVVTPLALAIRAEDAAVLDALVAARDRDVEGDVFGDPSDMWRYFEATAGGLITVAARRLGSGEALGPVAGRVLGLVNWLFAVPALRAAGRSVWPEGAEVPALVRAALADLAEVRRRWSEVPVAARPAFYPMAGAGVVLRRALRSPDLIEADGLAPGPFAGRLRMALMAGTGRVW